MPLHTGIGFPLKETAPNGWMEVQTDRELIRSSIIQILGTRAAVWVDGSLLGGERVMRPDFGANLPNMLFRPLNAPNKHMIVWSAINALTRWEKRINVRSLTFVQSLHEEEEGIVRLDLVYDIIHSGEVEGISITFSKEGVISYE